VNNSLFVQKVKTFQNLSDVNRDECLGEAASEFAAERLQGAIFAESADKLD
jgi:hypothetical protein